ncbi:lipoprotein [Providencia rettgeri]|uniref:lipoprotein n=1 Tax=Morganellaceae TaxID=1903414 RepID=UPI00123A4977|nr:MULTISPECIES: lipoprotein [Morganellaceae]ELZ9638951.1 lipoprotein [Proteus mirabilis]MCX3072450.1 lipoprotein [Providencia stuartii]NBN38922.1 lipoprotein [Proteus sp. G2638]NBN56480.1 lipoprotein [Proteus sp. G3927]QET97015.1 hypothetical protein FOB53_06955 [Providencia stuartii]
MNKKALYFIGAVIALSGCSYKNEYSGVDKSHCDTIYNEFKTSFDSADVCIDENLSKLYNTGTNQELLEVIYYKCKKDLNTSNKAYLHSIYCKMAQDNNESYFTINESISEKTEYEYLNRIEQDTKLEILEKIMKYRSEK